MELVSKDRKILVAFENEYECYVYAMESAYSMKQENELLVSVEFIAC